MASTKKLYALMVGVNIYHPDSKHVPNLNGCENDVSAMQGFLSQQWNKENYHPVLLLNEAATYQNIINNFRSHLSNAKAGDVVMFYYSGHGSREGAAPEFAANFEDGMQETLVCHDSRIPGGKDLADKELAVLLSEIDEGVHTIVILDCCHSGTGWRDADEMQYGTPRQASSKSEIRPLEEYIDGYYSQQLKNTGKIEIPTSQYIAMGACDKTEKAFEFRERVGRTKQGLFTHNLLKILSKSDGLISYADLFIQTRSIIKNSAFRQNPQFETIGRFDANAGFLDKSLSKGDQLYTLLWDNGQQSGTIGWKVKCGAFQNVPTDAAKEVSFEVFDENEKAVGFATGVEVGLNETKVKLDFTVVSKTAIYKAKLLSLPTLPLIFKYSGSGAEYISFKTFVEEKKSPQFDLSENNEKGIEYALSIENGIVNLTHLPTSRDLVYNDELYEQPLFDLLEDIAQWHKTLDLQNHNTSLNTKEVKITIVEKLVDNSERVHVLENLTDEVRFTYQKINGEWREIPFEVFVENKSRYDLYCSFLYQSSNYEIFEEMNELLPARDETNPNGSKRSLMTTSFILDEPKNEETDIFKFVLSRQPIDGFLITQGGLTDYEENKGSKSVGTRGLAKHKKVNVSGWFTKTFITKTVRQLSQINATENIEVANTMLVGSHNEFTADINLQVLNTNTRNVEGMSALSKHLENLGMQQMSFGENTRSVGNQSIIELSNIQNSESVTVENPLKITLNETLGEDEILIPMTHDGDFMIPIGTSENDENGNTVVNIEQIPETPSETRSIGRALKMAFFKIALKSKKEYMLNRVQYNIDGSFEQTTEGVTHAVANAKNVLLLVHGIIGNTEAMAEVMRPLIEDNDYDLILTYDYENLSTPIEETAALLLETLGKIGFNPDDDKRLTIMAHSMGGLVSRYMIEMIEGGKDIVDHLVLAGTPNAGSALSKLATFRDKAMPLLTLTINLGLGVPAFLVSALKMSKKITPTLEQMKENSEFIQALATSPDPKVRYTIFAGELHKYHEKNPKDTLVEKVLAGVAKMFYRNTPNDIAVSTMSINSVIDNRMPAPVKINVAAHHMNYFVEEGSLKEVLEVLKDTSKLTYASFLPEKYIKKVFVGKNRIHAVLNDDRKIGIPLKWFPKLKESLPEDLAQWELENQGTIIEWEDLGVAIPVSKFLS